MRRDRVILVLGMSLAVAMVVAGLILKVGRYSVEAQDRIEAMPTPPAASPITKS